MEKVIEAMKNGMILVLGECRGSKVETIGFVDRRTGQKAAFTVLNYLVERSNSMEPVLISQTLGDGTVDHASVKITAEKGKRYAFEITSLENGRGVLKGRMPVGVQPLGI